MKIDVRLKGETAWLTQSPMAELFQTTPQNITLHLQAIYEEGELTEAATCKDFLQVRTEGTRQVQRAMRHYNPRSQFKLAIEDTRDTGLPRVYSPELYHQKCSSVFEHFYENYTDSGSSVYTAVG
jgi:hypothetical protein